MKICKFIKYTNIISGDPKLRAYNEVTREVIGNY